MIANSFFATHPELAKEADGWDPESVSTKSNKKLKWICSLGHGYEAVVASRARGSGCPYCANKIVYKGFNDLESKHPDLAREADGWDPATVTVGTHSKKPWKCAEGHKWTAEVRMRVRGTGCPFCSGNRVLEGFNDFASRNPVIADQADGWEPREFTAHSNSRKSWKCDSGHVWIASLASRSEGTGCPKCMKSIIDIGRTDLATTYPAIAREAYGWDPTQVFAGSAKVLEWICALGHTWKARPNSRTTHGTGCPMCSGSVPIIGETDLATTHPLLAREAIEWEPTTVTAGSNKKLQWVCSLGHTYESRVASRVKGSGCPYCANKLVLVGFNDLKSKFPDVAMDADGWDPAALVSGSHRYLPWQCSKGHKWIAQVNSRTQGRGCPSCATSGFDPNLNGYLYLIENATLGLTQVGITNWLDQRLKQHAKRGWLPLDVRGPMDGQLTRELENAILTFLRTQNVETGPSNAHGKFDGYTESWLTEDFKTRSIAVLLEHVRLMEDG